MWTIYKIYEIDFERSVGKKINRNQNEPTLRPSTAHLEPENWKK